MAKKYYAVKKGMVPGIYETWEQCKAQIHGFSGASYKSFPTREEAEIFVGILGNDLDSEETKKCSDAIAYVDGSYEHSIKVFSYGVVFFAEDKIKEFAEAFQNEELVSMRNVAGEIMGAQKAMEYCLEKGINSLDLYYDYEGIEKWCTGEWKANKEGTKSYKAFHDSVKNQLNVTFYKVAAHTGDKYNELADQLAKKAIQDYQI